MYGGLSVDVIDKIESNLYEKMADSTSTWTLDRKYQQSKSNQKNSSANSKISKSGVKQKSSVNWNQQLKETTNEQAMGQWVVTEKVHGANFCFIYDVDSDRIHPAKRSSVLSNDDSFFGYRYAYETVLPKCMSIFQQCLQSHPTATRVYLFAELCGGSYPSTLSTASSSDIEAVQSEILYSPDLQFYFFDIAVEIKNTHEKIYIDYCEASRVWSDVGVLWAQPLFIGSFCEALDCSVDFVTTVPAMMGLPTLAGNVAEGVVIKPLIEVLLSVSGGSKGGRQRAIVKRKAERFLEKVTTYNTSSSLSQKGRSANAPDTVFNCLMSLLNANRLTAVRSKVGSKVSASTLTPLLLQDIMISAEEDNAVWVAWNSLTDAQRDIVKQRLSHRVSEFVMTALKR